MSREIEIMVNSKINGYSFETEVFVEEEILNELVAIGDAIIPGDEEIIVVQAFQVDIDGFTETKEKVINFNNTSFNEDEYWDVNPKNFYGIIGVFDENNYLVGYLDYTVNIENNLDLGCLFSIVEVIVDLDNDSSYEIVTFKDGWESTSRIVHHIDVDFRRVISEVYEEGY